MPLWNHFQAEQLLKNRLIRKIDLVENKRILSGLSVKEVIKKNNADKAIYVLYHDDVVSNDVSFDGTAQQVNQLWLVVVAVRNVRDATGKSAREQSGEIVDAVLKALQGFNMFGRFSSLRRKQCPFKNSYINGVMYLPMMFSTKITTIGVGDDDG